MDTPSQTKNLRKKGANYFRYANGVLFDFIYKDHTVKQYSSGDPVDENYIWVIFHTTKKDKLHLEFKNPVAALSYLIRKMYPEDIGREETPVSNSTRMVESIETVIIDSTSFYTIQKITPPFQEQTYFLTIYATESAPGRPLGQIFACHPDGTVKFAETGAYIYYRSSSNDDIMKDLLASIEVFI